MMRVENNVATAALMARSFAAIDDERQPANRPEDKAEKVAEQPGHSTTFIMNICDSVVFAWVARHVDSVCRPMMWVCVYSVHLHGDNLLSSGLHVHWLLTGLCVHLWLLTGLCVHLWLLTGLHVHLWLLIGLHIHLRLLHARLHQLWLIIGKRVIHWESLYNVWIRLSTFHKWNRIRVLVLHNLIYSFNY